MDDNYKQLVYAVDAEAQKKLIKAIKSYDNNYFYNMMEVLKLNPTIALSPEDRCVMNDINKVHTHHIELLLLRQSISKLFGKRICVFCMPKSGSTFISHVIGKACSLEFVLLSTFFLESPSAFGINGREQELDEYAILCSMSRTQGKFVAQHHTRCTPFLCLLLKFYNIHPIITVRNIFDCIVSLDDMRFAGRSTNNTWILDSWIPTPDSYIELPTQARLELLSYSFGVWLIHFYLTWKRCERHGFIQPLWIIYENDIVNNPLLAKKLSNYIGVNDAEFSILKDLIDVPEKQSIRFNKGVIGRGEAVPHQAKKFLMNYAKIFATELKQDDMDVLFGKQ